ncbi:p-hydroxybenzoic acid efflux pump subunit AaeA [Lachnospiraceae bacterium]|jgi:multidrug efflux pump subunit AcrA (membrane-fusion protein)|nr:biotin/lipoyl-binding protein [Lachnospiraceae bacterium]GFI29777.1 p-hydroxybenzoic acid efflux pump subunit AaeA [Lachnospiraceae bacterium]
MDRKKVIGIFSGFLAVMLLFTILSRAVTGASMARVETVKIKTGTIDHKVTGSGRVEAGKEIAVYTESGQRVKEIFVREGQSVEAGEVLFTVDLEELQEQILAAEQELEKSRLQNQDAQSARNVEQQNRERAKTRASEDYNQAVADGDASVAQAKAAWDQAEQALQNFLAEGPPEVNDGQSRAKQENDADEASGVRKDEEEEEKGPSGQSEQETGNDQNAADKLAAWEAEKARLEQAAAEAKGAYDSAVSSRTENVKTAARALEDANAPAASDTTSRQNEITSQQQELVLGKLQDLKHAEGRVTAPVQGVVTNISILTGDFTTEGTAMRLSDTSQGSRLTALVDKSNEKYVSKGSQVNISVPGSQEKITDYTVTSVTENEEDPTLLELVIDMPDGRLETGTRAEIEIVQRSENYSAVIPLQALHEEQNGYFVLVMEEEQGVMGKELVAKRYEVKVQDKNSTNAALEEGLLTSEQEIISSSSRSIGDGSRVRKMEGNSGL